MGKYLSGICIVRKKDASRKRKKYLFEFMFSVKLSASLRKVDIPCHNKNLSKLGKSDHLHSWVQEGLNEWRDSVKYKKVGVGWW